MMQISTAIIFIEVGVGVIYEVFFELKEKKILLSDFSDITGSVLATFFLKIRIQDLRKRLKSSVFQVNLSTKNISKNSRDSQNSRTSDHLGF